MIYGLLGRPVVAMAAVTLGQVALAAPPQADASRLWVNLKLDIGGGAAGLLLDHTDELIVLDFSGVPCAFAFDELQVASAYQAKRLLLAQARGGEGRLTAEDHYRLGLYALHREHPALANREFKLTQQADDRYDDRIADARQEYRSRRSAERREGRSAPLDEPPAPADQPVFPGLTETVGRIDPANREALIEAYKRFGQTVQQDVNEDLVLIETDHFLLWTDWPRHRQGQLTEWCEQMYAALSVQFGVPEGTDVFLAGKCPVFCFRSKARFLRFGRTYDGWAASNLVGYTRAAPSGHVHVVIYLRRATPYEIDRFAGTLVHEGVHAFLHRYRRTLNLMGWLPEGLADYMAEKVLGDRCLYGERSELVARQYVSRNIPIGDLLRNPGVPPAHEYPVAQSVVGYLIQRDPAAFVSVINDIKDGHPVEQALQRNFDGMTFDTLEASWRDHVAGGT